MRTSPRYYRLYDGDIRGEPIASVKLWDDRPYWIKVKGDWEQVFSYVEITKAEYDTDKAFELFADALVEYRPLRVWMKRHQRAIHIFMLAVSFTGLNVAVNFPQHKVFSLSCLSVAFLAIIWQLAKFKKAKWWSKIFDMEFGQQ